MREPVAKKKKLELTWVGKDERPKLEPRILIEDPEKSYHAKVRHSDEDIFDNVLIKGDNLLALKALEQDYAGKVKCIYIDPPFNTQQALENYDDGIEHSIWLSLMEGRLKHLKNLLSEKGTIFIHIDDNELGYLIVLADEIFGRQNRRSIISFKQGSATGHKSINPGCVSTVNYILLYSKDHTQWAPKRLFTARDRDKRYTKYIVNRTDDFTEWKFINLIEAFAEHSSLTVKEARKRIKAEPELIDNFVIANAPNVTRLARPDYKSVGKEIRAAIDLSATKFDEIIHVKREKYSDVYILNGERILFYSDKLKKIDGEYVSGEPLTTLWDDILSNNLHKEGGVSFPKGKKPELLIRRCLEMSTQVGDIVLDSFLGSGTTAAVAHKMKRKWIGIELGEQAETHVLPRLKRIIDNHDLDGATKPVGWKGGGGFRYYSLAPSLLETDKFGNWVISKDYNPAMLSEAMCKHMGFKYAPSQDEDEYWRHGHSTEADFIYVTTQNLTHDACKKLSDEVGEGHSLLICCKAYSANAEAFDNLTLVKIPTAILAKCEWGQDDYSLNVENLPMADALEEDEDSVDDLPLFAEGDKDA